MNSKILISKLSESENLQFKREILEANRRVRVFVHPYFPTDTLCSEKNLAVLAYLKERSHKIFKKIISTPAKKSDPPIIIFEQLSQFQCLDEIYQSNRKLYFWETYERNGNINFEGTPILAKDAHPNIVAKSKTLVKDTLQRFGIQEIVLGGTYFYSEQGFRNSVAIFGCVSSLIDEIFFPGTIKKIILSLTNWPDLDILQTFLSTNAVTLTADSPIKLSKDPLKRKCLV